MKDESKRKTEPWYPLELPGMKGLMETIVNLILCHKKKN